MQRDQRELVGVGLVGVLVGDERRLLEQPIQRVVGREVVVARRDLAKLEEVRPALLAFLGAVGEHRPVARPFEDVVEELGQGQDPTRERSRRTSPTKSAIAVFARPASSGTRPRPPAPGQPVRQVFARDERANDADRLVADRARRDVDDPLEAHRIGVRTKDPQVGQRVLDLLAGVEPRAAHDLVADAVAEARLLDRPRLGVRPVEDGDVAQVDVRSPRPARRVSSEPRAPVSSSTRRAIHSASSSSL